MLDKHLLAPNHYSQGIVIQGGYNLSPGIMLSKSTDLKLRYNGWGTWRTFFLFDLCDNIEKIDSTVQLQ